MTVAELGRRMSSAELTEWMAFDALDPIGAGRGDAQAALIASTVANYAGRVLPDGEAADLDEFMLRFGEDGREEIEAERAAKAERKRAGKLMTVLAPFLRPKEGQNG